MVLGDPIRWEVCDSLFVDLSARKECKRSLARNARFFNLIEMLLELIEVRGQGGWRAGLVLFKHKKDFYVCRRPSSLARLLACLPAMWVEDVEDVGGR